MHRGEPAFLLALADGAADSAHKIDVFHSVLLMRTTCVWNTDGNGRPRMFLFAFYRDNSVKPRVRKKKSPWPSVHSAAVRVPSACTTRDNFNSSMACRF